MGSFHTTPRLCIAAFLSIVLSFFAKAEEGSKTTENLEWQLPIDGQSYSSLVVSVSIEKQGIQEESFTDEVTVFGKIRQSFIVCAQRLSTDHFSHEASAADTTIFSDNGEMVNIHALTLSDAVGKLTIEQSSTCPKYPDQPVIDQWPQGNKDHQPEQLSAGGGSGQRAGSSTVSRTQAALQPSGINSADQKTGKSKKPVWREITPKWLGGSGHYFIIRLPVQEQSGGAGNTRKRFYIDQKQLAASMKGEEKAAIIEARSRFHDEPFTFKLDQVEAFMGIPCAQREQGTSTLAYLLRYGTPATLLNLYRFYGIATLGCVNGRLIVQRDQRDLRTEYQCPICQTPAFSQDTLITTPCCQRVYHPDCLAHWLQVAAETQCPGCHQITLEPLNYLFNTEDGKNKGLLVAACSDNLSVLKTMLKAGVNPDTADIKGNTGLHLSANRNHLRAIGLLLAFGANPVIRNQKQETAKDWATRYKHWKIADDLALAAKNPSIFFKLGYGDIDYVGHWLEDGNDIAITREPDGFTLLHLAVDHRHHGLAELLIQHAAGLNSGLLDKPDYSRRTPLHLACYHGDEPMVRLLLDAGADSSPKDLWQQTPEDVVRVRNHRHLLPLLDPPESSTPAQLSHTDYRLTLQPHEQGENGKTALHEAAEKGDPEMVRLLIDNYGLDRNAKNNSELTALHFAAAKGRSDVIRLLIDEYGLDKEAKDKSGNTPMNLAIMSSQLETIKALHELGVAINTEHFFTAVKNHLIKVIQLLVELGGHPDECGSWYLRTLSPLHMAVILKDNAAIEALVAAGVNPNSINRNSSRTPLHQAVTGEPPDFCRLTDTPVCQGDPDIIRTLVKAGARLDQAVGSDHWTVLHHTAMAGNAELTKRLLELGAGTEVRDSLGRTALYWAAEKNHVQAMTALIHYGAGLDTPDNKMRTPLHQAVAHGNVEAIQQLINGGADREAREQTKGFTPLHLAIANGQKEMARMLVQQGARVDSQNNEGQNALHIAAKSFSSDELEAFAFEFDTPEILASWQIKDHKGRTPAEVKNLPFLKGLSDPLSAKGTAALIAAAKTGNSQQIKVLLKAGVPSGQTDSRGWTPLHYAVKHRQQDVIAIRLLIDEYGLDRKAKVNNGRTALHIAAQQGHVDAIRLLIDEYGLDRKAKVNNGRTALHIAAQEGHVDAIRLLIDEYGLDKNAKTITGKTALHYAVQQGHVDAIRLLIDEYGLDRKAKVNNGRTALHIAAQEGHVDAIRLLIDEYRLGRNAKANNGRTALHIAAQEGHADAIRLLIDKYRLLRSRAGYYPERKTKIKVIQLILRTLPLHHMAVAHGIPVVMSKRLS